MNKGVNRLIEKLTPFADAQKSFDVQSILNLGTLDVICGSCDKKNLFKIFS